MSPSPISSDTLSDDIISAANIAYVSSHSLVPASQAPAIDYDAKKLKEEERQQRLKALLSTLEPEKIDLIKQQLASASTLPDGACLDAGMLAGVPEAAFTYTIDYHLDLGKIIQSTPIVLADQTLNNDTDVEQEMSFSLDKAETHTSTYEYSFGMKFGSEVTLEGESYKFESCSCAYG